MPTRAEVQLAEPITEDDVSWLLPVIKETVLFGKLAAVLPSLEDTLAAVVDEASYKARYIGAIIEGIEGLGDSEVSIAGGKDAVYFSIAENRESFVRLVLSVLYNLADYESPTIYTTATAVGRIGGNSCCCLVRPCVHSC